MPLLIHPETGERVDASPEGAKVLREEGYTDAEAGPSASPVGVPQARRLIVDSLDADEYDAASPDRIGKFLASGWRTYAEKVLEYERSHQNRNQVVAMIEARLEALPDPDSDHPEAQGQPVVASGRHVDAVVGVPSTDRPAKSASREDWNAYAQSLGIDPEEHSSKDDLIEAVDEKERSDG
jgi:hypothetical protein